MDIKSRLGIQSSKIPREQVLEKYFDLYDRVQTSIKANPKNGFLDDSARQEELSKLINLFPKLVQSADPINICSAEIALEAILSEPPYSTICASGSNLTLDALV